MTCGSKSYPKWKDETVGQLNNYHVSKQLTRNTPEKEEVAFTHTNSNTKVETKTNKTKNRVE